MKNEKFYSIQEALKMLPYLVSYSKDIKCYFERIALLVHRMKKISNLHSLSIDKLNKISKTQESIRSRILNWNKRVEHWEEELLKMNIRICDVPRGRINVPVYFPLFESIVCFCVIPTSTEENVEWHFEEESYEDARPYFEFVNI